MRLLPVRQTEEEKLPWSKNSIYKYSCRGDYPDIIIRVGRKLFVDMDAFENLARKNRDAQVQKSEAARRRA